MRYHKSVDTPAGVLRVGDTWDAALPKLQTIRERESVELPQITRSRLERIDPDCWVEVRHLGVDLATTPSQSYELTWERRDRDGPYTLVGIRQLDPEVL